MATLGLSFQLSANAQQMSAGINAGVVELQKLGYQARKTAQDVGTLKTIELSRVFISAVRTAANGFTTFVAGSAAAVASVDDLSQRTGVSTQTLQAYQFAAEQSGVSVETFGRAVQKLGVNLGEAQTGNASAVQSFGELGLSVEELSRLKPEQAFEAVAAAISELPNPAQQAAAAVSLFGKSGVDLVPVFRQGAGFLEQMRAEAERLGLVLSQDQTRSLATLDDSIGKVSASFRALTARVVAELAPSLIKAADDAATFIASIDVRQVAAAAQSALAGLADAISAAAAGFTVIYRLAAPLAATIFPLIGDAVRFIADNLRGAALGAGAAAAGLGAYSVACGAATISTATFAAAIRSLLASTGIGVLVVALGAVGGALLEWSFAGESAGANVADAVSAASEQIAAAVAATKKATDAVRAFGAEADEAFKLPAEITDQTLLQGTIEKAATAFRSFAQEAGRLTAVPQAIRDAFTVLQTDIENVNAGTVDVAVGQDLIAQSAAEVLRLIEQAAAARREEAQQINDVVRASEQAAEAAARTVRELAASGVTDAEQSRLRYVQDLAAIEQAIADARSEAAAAVLSADSQGILAAQERLRIVQQTAEEARRAAEQQKRDRDLAALGLDESLLKPAKTVLDEFQKVRQAFDARLINGSEASQALRNLAAEGINIRREIAAELSSPAQQALQANDVRTQEGASQVLRLAGGRADPALEQRREQLSKLEEIRQALVAIGVRPATILGA